MTENEKRREETVRLLVLTGLCLFLYLFQLGSRPIWDLDEGMHASTSRVMVESGDWVMTTYNGEAFYNKPAFFNWLVAASFSVLGFTEFAARLPAALIGLLIVLVTYRLGKRIGGPNVGFLAGIVQATAAEHLLLARTVVHDSALGLSVVLALLAFYEAYEDESRRKRMLLLFWVGCGLGFLAKGPVGVMLPGMVVFLFLLVERRLRFLLRMGIGWGLLVFLLIGAPWYVAISLRDPSYFEYFFWEQNFGRFLSAASSTPGHHAEPVWYYLGVLVAGFIPWGFLVPVALWRGWKTRKGPEGRGVRFCLIWFFSILLFFSAASAKLATYVYPLFPAGSILLALMLAGLLGSPARWLVRGVRISYLLFAAPLVAAGIGMIFWVPGSLERKTGISPYDLIGVGVPAALFALVAVWSLLRGNVASFVRANVFLVAVTVVGFTILLAPSMEPYRSTRLLATRIDQALPPDAEVHFFRRFQDSVIYYTGRKGIVLENVDSLLDHLDSEERVFCIVERRHIEKHLDADERFEGAYHVVARWGDRTIISNQDGPFAP